MLYSQSWLDALLSHSEQVLIIIIFSSSLIWKRYDVFLNQSSLDMILAGSLVYMFKENGSLSAHKPVIGICPQLLSQWFNVSRLKLVSLMIWILSNESSLSPLMYDIDCCCVQVAHSISWHPSGTIVVVANSRADVQVKV